MFFNELWILILERLTQVLSIPSAICQRIADEIRKWQADGNVLLGVITVILSIAGVVTLSAWIFSSPNADLKTRLVALEAENRLLKERTAPDPVAGTATNLTLPATSSGTTLVLGAGLATPAATPAEIEQNPIAILQDEVAGVKEEIAETEKELKDAKEKPDEAEREVSEIQSDLKTLRAELATAQKALKAALKAAK